MHTRLCFQQKSQQGIFVVGAEFSSLKLNIFSNLRPILTFALFGSVSLRLNKILAATEMLEDVKLLTLAVSDLTSDIAFSTDLVVLFDKDI